MPHLFGITHRTQIPISRKGNSPCLYLYASSVLIPLVDYSYPCSLEILELDTSEVERQHDHVFFNSCFFMV
jgi:hypothetical protein